jgi:O-antigen/teichoic acid export membrane protein
VQANSANTAASSPEFAANSLSRKILPDLTRTHARNSMRLKILDGSAEKMIEDPREPKLIDRT